MHSDSRGRAAEALSEATGRYSAFVLFNTNEAELLGLFPVSFDELKRLTGGIVSYNISEAIDPSIREQLTALRNVARKLPTPGENFSHDNYPLAPLLTDAHHLAEAIDRGMVEVIPPEIAEDRSTCAFSRISELEGVTDRGRSEQAKEARGGRLVEITEHALTTIAARNNSFEVSDLRLRRWE